MIGVDKPLIGYKFVANFKKSTIGVVTEAISELYSGDEEDDFLVTEGTLPDTISVWVTERRNSCLERQRIETMLIRLAVEDEISRGIFDNEDVWYPIYREADLSGDEWYRALETTLRYSDVSTPEGSVAAGLLVMYLKVLKSNPRRLFRLFDSNGVWSLVPTIFELSERNVGLKLYTSAFVVGGEGVYDSCEAYDYYYAEEALIDFDYYVEDTDFDNDCNNDCNNNFDNDCNNYNVDFDNNEYDYVCDSLVGEKVGV